MLWFIRSKTLELAGAQRRRRASPVLISGLISLRKRTPAGQPGPRGLRGLRGPPTLTPGASRPSSSTEHRSLQLRWVAAAIPMGTAPAGRDRPPPCCPRSHLAGSLIPRCRFAGFRSWESEHGESAGRTPAPRLSFQAACSG